MRRRLLAVMTVIVGLGAAVTFVPSVGAAPITRTYDFSAIEFSAFSGAVPPTDPVTGSVTVTFDAALTSLDFPVDAITLTIDGHAYSAAEVTADFPFGLGDALLIGATVKTNGELESGTDDFAFVINDASTAAPSLALFAYTSAGELDSFETTTGAVTLPAAAVPEPGSWLVLTSGLAGLFGYGWRSRSCV
jgi:PEP-CTERM motif